MLDGPYGIRKYVCQPVMVLMDKLGGMSPWTDSDSWEFRGTKSLWGGLDTEPKYSLGGTLGQVGVW